MGPADQSIECSGAEASFHTAIHVSRIEVEHHQVGQCRNKH